MLAGLLPVPAFRRVSPFVPRSAEVATRQTLTVSLAQVFPNPGRSGSFEIVPPQNYALLERKYGVSAWVYICVSRKARDLSAGPLRVMEERGGELTPVKAEHPLQALLHRVNPWMTMEQLLQITSTYLDLVGNAFWLLRRGRNGRGQVEQIFPLNPMAAKILGAPDAPVDYYEVWHYNQPYRFRAWRPGQAGEILHFARVNPTSDDDSAFPSVWGVGPLEAAWTLVLTDEDMVKWNRNLVRNDGRPSGLLSSEQDISLEDAQASADRFRQIFSGPESAGKMLVLGKGLKYERVALQPKEADYKETSILLREEILATFDLNSAVLGLAQGDIGRRLESHRDYWEGAIVSTSKSYICPPITEFLAPEYGDNLRVVQDFSNQPALQENEDERSQVVARYHERAIPFTVLNARFKLGFPRFPGDDIPYIGGGLMPALEPILPLPSDEEPDTEPETTPKPAETEEEVAT